MAASIEDKVGIVQGRHCRELQGTDQRNEVLILLIIWESIAIETARDGGNLAYVLPHWTQHQRQKF